MNKILAAVFLAVVLSAAPAAWADSPAAAPDGTTTQLPAWLQYKPVYKGEENDIANPHRTADEMATWAQQAAADLLSFSKDDEEAKMAAFRQKYFVDQGWQLYTAYLKDAKILDMVDGQGYSVTTIVSEVPEIVNKGSAGGSYHWILRMPITISFYKKDPATGESKPGNSAKFFLFIHALRVADGGGTDGLAIMDWRVVDVPKN